MPCGDGSGPVSLPHQLPPDVGPQQTETVIEEDEVRVGVEVERPFAGRDAQQLCRVQRGAFKGSHGPAACHDTDWVGWPHTYIREAGFTLMVD